MAAASSVCGMAQLRSQPAAAGSGQQFASSGGAAQRAGTAPLR